MTGSDALLRDLVTLVRCGFLVTVGDRRTVADDIKNPELRALLFGILQAANTDAARAALDHRLQGGPAAEGGERHAFRTDRDLLMEFVQWVVDHGGPGDIFDDPDDERLDQFLTSVGGSR